jgi:hypothetical protein
MECLSTEVLQSQEARERDIHCNCRLESTHLVLTSLLVQGKQATVKIEPGVMHQTNANPLVQNANPFIQSKCSEEPQAVTNIINSNEPCIILKIHIKECSCLKRWLLILSVEESVTSVTFF